MPEQTLNGVDIHPRLQQVRGEGVTQAVNPALLGDLGATLGRVVHLLRKRTIDAALPVARGKQPVHGPGRAPVQPQQFQQARR